MMSTQPATYMQAAYDFLHTIFSTKAPEHHLLIWELHKHDGSESFRNYFFTDIERAAHHAITKQQAGTDMYFGVSTLAQRPKRGRGKLADMAGIGAIHLDVDIAHAAAHKKQNLPPTVDAAIEFVSSAGVAPSIIINSGYGLHVYWLLQKFWIFGDDEQRTRAGQLIETWQRMFKWRAGHHGWDIDATQDLTRVLRVPGTLNYKLPEQPVQASLLHFQPDTRYTLEYFDQTLAALHTQMPPAQPQVQAKNVQQIKPQPAQAGHWSQLQLVLDENASVSGDRFEAAMENLPKFKQTWQRKRRDMQDQSASAYDISLANMVVAVGWTPQEACNLLIQHRRKHGDEKMRLDYYQRTIFEALAGTQQYREQRERAEIAQAPVDPTDKEAIKQALQRVLGFRIERIEKILSDPPQYIFHFPNGKQKNLGDSGAILDQKQFARHIANLIDKVVPRMKDAVWQPTAQKMLDMAEQMPEIEETTELGEVKEILRTYLDEYLPTNITLQHHRQCAARHQPAVIDGVRVAINALEVWKYARRNYGSKLSKSELINLMCRLGAKRDTTSVRDDRGKKVNISVYMLPDEWTPEKAVRELAPGVATDEDDG